jgi:hypothetical protein
MPIVQYGRYGRIARNLAVYAAGAWAVVEFVDFATGKFGLSADFLDFTMFFAVAGSLFVVVLSWYHGEPGRQKFAPIEIGILGVLAVIVIVGIFAIGMRDPFSEFDKAEGFRLTLAFRDGPPDKTSNCNWSWTTNEEPSSLADMKRLAELNFFMSPTEFRLTIPGVRLFGEHIPVRMMPSDKDELNRMVVVLPYMPEDLRLLLQSGVDHNFGRIESANFVLQIDRAFTVVDQGNSATIRINGPFALNGSLDCEIEDDQ